MKPWPRRHLPTRIAALLGFALLLLPGRGTAETGPAEEAGLDLIRRIRSLTPEASVTNRGRWVVRPARPRAPFEIPLLMAVFPTTTGWCNFYEMGPDPQDRSTRLWIRHSGERPPCVSLATWTGSDPAPDTGRPLSAEESMQPLAETDFSPADLAMAFLWWPRHRLIRSEMRRGQFCDVVESETDHTPPGGYLRVRAWFDRDTAGLVYAEAFDAHGRLLKEFLPRRFRKIDGRWEVTELEMIHRQNGSRTRLGLEH